MAGYNARQGDIIWLDFSPHAGREQAGKRPAVVVSNNTANALMGTRAMVCPITSNYRRMAVEPTLDDRTRTHGVILCDQVRVLDMVAREAEFIEELPQDILFEVIDIINGITEYEWE